MNKKNVLFLVLSCLIGCIRALNETAYVTTIGNSRCSGCAGNVRQPGFYFAKKQILVASSQLSGEKIYKFDLDTGFKSIITLSGSVHKLNTKSWLVVVEEYDLAVTGDVDSNDGILLFRLSTMTVITQTFDTDSPGKGNFEIGAWDEITKTLFTGTHDDENQDDHYLAANKFISNNADLSLISTVLVIQNSNLRWYRAMAARNGIVFYVSDKTNKYTILRRHYNITSQTFGAEEVAAGSSNGYQDGIGTAAKFDVLKGLCLVNNILYITDSRYRIRYMDIRTDEVGTLGGSWLSKTKDGLIDVATYNDPKAITYARYPFNALFIFQFSGSEKIRMIHLINDTESMTMTQSSTASSTSTRSTTHSLTSSPSTSHSPSSSISRTISTTKTSSRTTSRTLSRSKTMTKPSSATISLSRTLALPETQSVSESHSKSPSSSERKTITLSEVTTPTLTPPSTPTVDQRSIITPTGTIIEEKTPSATKQSVFTMTATKQRVPTHTQTTVFERSQTSTQLVFSPTVTGKLPLIPPTHTPTLITTPSPTSMPQCVTVSPPSTLLETVTIWRGLQYSFQVSNNVPLPRWIGQENLTQYLVLHLQESPTKKPNPNGFNKYHDAAMKDASFFWMNQTHFELKLQPLPQYDIVDDESLEIGVHSRWIESRSSICKPASAVVPLVILSFKAPPIPVIASTKTATEVVTQVAITAGVSGASSAAADAQALAVLAFMSCAQSAEKKMMRNHRMLAPTAISDSFVGVLAGNFILFIGIVIAQGIVILVLKRIWHLPRWRESMAYSRCPALILSVLILIYQPTGFASIQLLKEPSNGTEFAFGFCGLLWTIATPFSFYYVGRRWVKGQYGEYTWDVHPILRYILPIGRWYPQRLRRQFGPFTGMRMRNQLWLMFPLCSPTILMLASSASPSSIGGCEGQYGIITVGQFILALIVLIVRPSRSLPANIASAASYACLGFVTSGSLMAMKNPAGNGRYLTIYAVQVQLSVLVIRIMYMGFTGLFETRLLLRCGEWQEKFQWRPVKSKNVKINEETESEDEDSDDDGEKGQLTEMEQALLPPPPPIEKKLPEEPSTQVEVDSLDINSDLDLPVEEEEVKHQTFGVQNAKSMLKSEQFEDVKNMLDRMGQGDADFMQDYAMDVEDNDEEEIVMSSMLANELGTVSKNMKKKKKEEVEVKDVGMHDTTLRRRRRTTVGQSHSPAAMLSVSEEAPPSIDEVEVTNEMMDAI